MIIPFILITFQLNSGVKLVEGTSWENCSTTGLLFRDWTYEKNRSHHQDKKFWRTAISFHSENIWDNLNEINYQTEENFGDSRTDLSTCSLISQTYLLIFGKPPIPSSFCFNVLNTKRYYRYKLPLKRIFVSLPVVQICDFYIVTVINDPDFSFQVIHCTQSRKLSSPG